MANARTRFDTIRDYMVRSHSATSGTLYGKPCALLNGHAFVYFHQGWAAFLLNGRVRLQALALPGARFWDPMGREGPSMDWIIVPDTHFLRWDRLAIEAVKSAHGLSKGRRPTAAPSAGPPQPPPAANRWINSIKLLFAKAASLTLAQQEALPEKPISRIFAETGADLGDSDASAIAALAEPVAAEQSSSPAPFKISEPAASEGRASFSIGTDADADDKPELKSQVAGRASFDIGGDPVSAVVGAEPTAPPPLPPEPDAPPDAPSWAISDAETESSPEPVDEKPADDGWAEKIAKFQLEATVEGDTGPTPTEGRAVFAAREPDPLPSVEPKFKIKEPEQPMGRASFMVADDPPDAEQPAADGGASEQGPGAADGLDYEPVSKD